MSAFKRNAAHPQDEDSNFPLAEEINAIAKQIVASGNHWIELQNQAVGLLMAELSHRYRTMLTNINGAAGQTQWPDFGQANLQRSMENARNYWEVTTRTQQAMSSAIHECLGQPKSNLSSFFGLEHAENEERRMRSVVIKFPDRRLAA